MRHTDEQLSRTVLPRLTFSSMSVALAVQVLPAVMVASHRYSSAVPDVRVRLLLATLYLVIPNSSEIFVNLTDAQWHLAVLSVLVVLALPATGGWRVFDVAVLALSGRPT